MENYIYLVTKGYYEENHNTLLTASLDKAIKEFLNDGASIQIWFNEEMIHEYGIYNFETMNNTYENVYAKIKFIEENGFKKYMEKAR